MDGHALNEVHMSHVTLDAFKIQRTKYRHVCAFLFHWTSFFFLLIRSGLNTGPGSFHTPIGEFALLKFVSLKLVHYLEAKTT